MFNVIDYKSGKRPSLSQEKIASGERLQPALYVMAAQALLFEGDRATPLWAGYWSMVNGVNVDARFSLQCSQDFKSPSEHWETTADERRHSRSAASSATSAPATSPSPAATTNAPASANSRRSAASPRSAASANNGSATRPIHRSMTSTATLTDEQSKALHTRDTSIALAAGAGCGKTFVLSERFLSHLDHDSKLVQEAAELHQLIAITFTDAAAREMRRRIRQKCYERSQTAPTKESQDAWLKLLRAIEAARVSTIHAFCTSLLRAARRRGRPRSDVRRARTGRGRRARERSDRRRAARAARGTRPDDDGARRRLRPLASSRNSSATCSSTGTTTSFHKWRATTADELVAVWRECHETRWPCPRRSRSWPRSPESRDDRGTAAIRHAAGEESRNLSTAQGRAAREAAASRHAASSDEIELTQLREHVGVRIDLHREGLAVEGELTKPTATPASDSATRSTSTRRSHSRRQPPARPPNSASSCSTWPTTRPSNTNARKARDGKLDFDDLLFRAKELLTIPAHASLRERLSERSAAAAWSTSFKTPTRCRSNWCRRSAATSPTASCSSSATSTSRSTASAARSPMCSVDLREQVPEAGPVAAHAQLSQPAGDAEFRQRAVRAQRSATDYEPLRANRPQTTAEPAIEFLWTLTPDKNEPPAARTTPASRKPAASPAACASSSRPKRRSSPTLRPTAASARVQPGDVAILFRALSDVALYEAALREYGLDYYLVGGHAFYAQQEIFDVLNLLRAVASAADEISLAGVLRSPFFSLADETLFWLVESAGSLNDGLFAEPLPKELSADERLKVAAAAETLAYLRARQGLAPDHDAARRSARPHRLRRRAPRRIPGRAQAGQSRQAASNRPALPTPAACSISPASSRSSPSSSPASRRKRSPRRSPNRPT